MLCNVGITRLPCTRVLSLPCSALQGLLRKLGAGLDEALLAGMSGMSGSRFRVSAALPSVHAAFSCTTQGLASVSLTHRLAVHPVRLAEYHYGAAPGSWGRERTARGAYGAVRDAIHLI